MQMLGKSFKMMPVICGAWRSPATRRLSEWPVALAGTGEVTESLRLDRSQATIARVAHTVDSTCGFYLDGPRRSFWIIVQRARDIRIQPDALHQSRFVCDIVRLITRLGTYSAALGCARSYSAFARDATWLSAAAVAGQCHYSQQKMLEMR